MELEYDFLPESDPAALELLPDEAGLTGGCGPVTACNETCWPMCTTPHSFIQVP